MALLEHQRMVHYQPLTRMQEQKLGWMLQLKSLVQLQMQVQAHYSPPSLHSPTLGLRHHQRH